MSKSFDESKVSRDQKGRFKDQNKHHVPTDLPAADSANTPVGEEFIDDANTIASELFDRKQDWDDLPIGGCYRINDFGDYVTEEDWDAVWDGHPLEEKAWMLADNGRYTSDEVARMSPDEIEAAYDEGDIYIDTYDQHPAYAYYTEKYEEDDYDLDEPIGEGMASDIQQTGEQLAGQSRESMDFEPGEHVHATPDGFVSDTEWEQAWGDQPAYARAAYELSCRHPGLNMENLSPKQIITMNNSEQAYEEYIYEDGGTHHLRESDTMLSKQDRLSADMYRQNERNTQYAGRDLNDVICMRESTYTGNNGTLTANVQRSTLRMLDSPNPTADMDSMSTIALGLNHDPDNTVHMITGQMSGHSDAHSLKQSLKEQLDSDTTYDHENAERLSTALNIIANNADDTQGAGWLATSLGAFADYRHGDKGQARRTANEVRHSLQAHADDPATRSKPWQTVGIVADAILDA